jgi:hypothetical protein
MNEYILICNYSCDNWEIAQDESGSIYFYDNKIDALIDAERYMNEGRLIDYMILKSCFKKQNEYKIHDN